MGTKLYVGNLPYSATNDSLAAHFAQCGNVTQATVITDKFSGRSKGFGFVEFDTAEAAEKAIATLHGTDFEGRNLVVNEARPKEDRPRGDFGGGSSQGGSRGGYSSGGNSRGGYNGGNRGGYNN
ncbi:MAG: RNA-binding protein [bacterium]